MPARRTGGGGLSGLLVESEFLREDPVFGVRDSLIRSFEADENGELATTFDVVLDRT